MSCSTLIVVQANIYNNENYNGNIRTALSGSASMANVTSQFAATSSGEDPYLHKIKDKEQQSLFIDNFKVKSGYLGRILQKHQ